MKFKIKSPAWTALPAKPLSNKIALAGADGVVRSFSKTDGREIWSTRLSEEALDVRVSDTHVVAAGRDSLAVLEQQDGQLLWQADARDIVGLTNNVVLTQSRGELEARNLSDGELRWKAESHQPAQISLGMTLSLSGVRGRTETLEVRDSDSGELQWSTTDGNIEHVVARPDSVLYTNQKIGRHHETVQLVTSRTRDGEIQWTHQCGGKLRAEPKYSPDGKQLSVCEQHPTDPSRSVVSVLSADSGELLNQMGAGHQVDVTFLSGGQLVLAETEYSRIPDQGEKRLRVVSSEGRELWSEEGRPQWMMGGEQLLTWNDGVLKSREGASGQIRWQQEFQGEVIPVSTDGEKACLLQNGCHLFTVDLESGKKVDELTTGHQLMLDDQPNGLVSDHEGQVVECLLPTGMESLFVGQWEKPEPFHIPFLSGPAKRDGYDAVFVDWDGDEKDGGEDPILLDAKNKPVTWAQLQARDAQADSTLETPELDDLKLWFDMNRDGEVSSAAELSALIAENSFDKGRLHLDRNQLWLASDSVCRGQL